MTILHIITGLSDGGAEAVLFRLCIHDDVHQHVVISLMGAGKYGPLLEERGIPVVCMNMKRGRVSLGGLWRLWRTLRELRPETVQTWMYHADLLGGAVARLAGRRNVIWGIHHTTLIPGESRRSTILVARLCARLSRLIPRRIICCAEKAREVHAGLGYDSTRMKVIPNGYDLSTFRPDPEARARLRAELDLPDDRPVIGFVARFDPLKDHSNLCRALRLLRDRKQTPICLLVGAGMEEDNTKLAALLDEYGVRENVRLLGQRADIPAVMNALDLHVMSSSTEGFPNVLAEAMACGTPCVSTDVGDAAAILGETGRIVPPRDPAALTEAIADLLAERATAAWPARQAAARQHVASHFSIQRMVESYREVWFGEVNPGSAKASAGQRDAA